MIKNKEVFMRFIISLLLTLNTFALSLDDLYGCFKTLEYNGTAPENGPIAWRNQTLFEDLGNQTYQHIDTKIPMDVSVLTVFRGFQAPWYGYSPLVIFPNYGKMTETDNSFEYFVDMDVWKLKYGIAEKVDHYIDLKMQEVDGIISGRVIFKSTIRDFDRRLSFKIEKQNCISE